MTLAITGATGFVGSAVLLKLQGDKIERARTGLPEDIRALARSPRPSPYPDVEWVKGSLSDHEALDQLVRRAESVLHIAGLTTSTDPEALDRVNVDGTANVIDAARRAGVRRLVFVSSLSAREPHLSAYGASKAKAEKLVAASGMDWTIVRPPAVYGPHDKDMFELFRSAKWGIIPLPPPGRASLIHADDLARLLLNLLRVREESSSAMYEPDDGHEDGWSHHQIAEMIGKAMGRKIWAPSLSKATLEWAARADTLMRGKKAKLTADRAGYLSHPDWVVRRRYQVPAEIWQPTISAPEGIAATANWYREQKWL